jgi:tetratricopeptide (TPR) repeat protein/putative Mn2+ efflux pump MntP
VARPVRSNGLPVPAIRRARPLTLLRSERLALYFAVAAGVVLCLLPLAGTLGPESALAIALWLSPWAAATGAARALWARRESVRTGLLLARAIGLAWLPLAVMVGLVALNALRVKTCEPFSGLAFIALGPFMSVTFAAVVGVALGSVVNRRWAAITLAVLVPFVAIAVALYRFVSTPGVYFFGHFYGYFPGTFYDRRIDVPDAWLSHRLLTVLLALGLWALLETLRHTRTGLMSPARISKHPVLAAFSVACAIGSLWIARNAHELGHTTSRAHVEHKLGLAIEGERCRVVLPRETKLADAHRLAEDCDFRIGQVERTLGVKERERITAFFFRSASEKRALMGAARVYIAKPWRREVYLQLSEYPHPILAHELAHVVARVAASGPFGVPGALGGVIPEPTLVEGMAVALEPAPRGELTPHQWARAAHEVGVAQPLASLLGPRFFGANQQLAYTLAGSFLRYVLDTQGAETVRRIYREADVERVLKKPFATLEREWKAWLTKVPLPREAQALAKQRFERPSVFSQVCPHAVERLDQELSAALSAGDLGRAIDTCRAVLTIDPKDTDARATLSGVLARTGQVQAAQAELAALEGPKRAPSATIAAARTSLADAAFMRGDHAAAERAYRALLSEPQAEEELRQLEVKLLALEAGDPTRRLLGELLIGRDGAAADARTAMHLIHALYPQRTDGLAHYLEARQLARAERHDLAFPLFREALSRGLPTRRLIVEALRARALSAYVVGALEDARESQERIAALADATLAERMDAEDFVARVAHRKRVGSRAATP